MKTVIKFSMQFCQPCKQLKPIFDDVVKDIPDIKVVEIDVEEHPDIASNYKVKSIPTIIIVDEDETIISMKSGFMNKNELERFIKNGMAS